MNTHCTITPVCTCIHRGLRFEDDAVGDMVHELIKIAEEHVMFKQVCTPHTIANLVISTGMQVRSVDYIAYFYVRLCRRRVLSFAKSSQKRLYR